MGTFKDYPVRIFDASQWQDNPDTAYKPKLEKIAEAGFMGMGVRVGYGLVEDTAFRWFWSEAKGKFERMPYWYLDYYSHRKTGTTDEEWGREQANVAWRLLKSDAGELPLALDCEESSFGGRVTIYNKGSYNRVARAFAEEYERLSGSRILIYTAPGFLWVFEAWAKNRKLWLAWYNRTITAKQVQDKALSFGWTGQVVIWQYASDGDINNDGTADGFRLGFETNPLDLNVFLGTVEEWSRFAGTTPPVEPIPSEDPVPVEAPLFSNYRNVPLGKVVGKSGLNIRVSPKYGTAVSGWIPTGTTLDILEVIKESSNIWARVGVGQFVAIRYNGTVFIG